MKDSGIEWIGEIPEGWEIGQIGQLYSERRTKVSDKDYPPLSVTMKGILPQLSTAAKTDAHDDRKLVCKGDFAINSRSDRRGSCGISAQDGSISLINTVLQPRREMNPGYYNWLFHTSLFADEFYKWGHGIVDDLWTTGWSDMKKIGVPVPSKCEQKQLAEYLNFECFHIDSILSKTRSSIEEYKKLKQAVITQAVTKGVRGEREMKLTGFTRWSEIPFDWDLKRVKSCVASISSGLSAVTDDANSEESGKFVLRTSAVSSGFFVPTEAKPVLKSAVNRLICPVEPDTLIVSRMNTASMVGACAYVANNHPNTFLPDKLWKIKFLPNYHTKYMWYALNSVPAKSWFSELATGASSSMQNISINDFTSNYLPIPAFSEQKEIADCLDAKCAEIDGLIAKKEQLVKELESYKKSLIYEVVTGKREV